MSLFRRKNESITQRREDITSAWDCGPVGKLLYATTLSLAVIFFFSIVPFFFTFAWIAIAPFFWLATQITAQYFDHYTRGVPYSFTRAMDDLDHGGGHGHGPANPAHWADDTRQNDLGYHVPLIDRQRAARINDGAERVCLDRDFRAVARGWTTRPQSRFASDLGPNWRERLAEIMNEREETAEADRRRAAAERWLTSDAYRELKQRADAGDAGALDFIQRQAEYYGLSEV